MQKSGNFFSWFLYSKVKQQKGSRKTFLDRSIFKGYEKNPLDLPPSSSALQNLNMETLLPHLDFVSLIKIFSHI